jgi:hypothetical protein
MRLTLLIATLLIASGSNMAPASPPTASDSRSGRFVMQPIEGGFLRLDTATGDMSLCATAGLTFECKPVKDDRDLQAEIARLSDENKELKAEIKRLDELLALNSKQGSKPKLELPSEADVDQALSYLERMFKKFRDKMKELEAPSDGTGKGTPL